MKTRITIVSNPCVLCCFPSAFCLVIMSLCQLWHFSSTSWIFLLLVACASLLESASVAESGIFSWNGYEDGSKLLVLLPCWYVGGITPPPIWGHIRNGEINNYPPCMNRIGTIL